MKLKNRFLKNKLSMCISASIASLVSSTYADAQVQIEEIVVTSSFIDRTVDEIINPLHIVNGEEISSSATQSLGETLDGLLGVSSADYGSAVGQPIIRGLSGGRVKVLNNGMVVRDVSGLGGDHNVEIDLNNVDQIEVVRGPSSLLYANGGIGGIVNIVDSTIAREDFSESDLRLGLESQSVNDGETYDFSYQNNMGGLNFSLGYKKSQFGDFDIPDGAVLHDEEEHEEDHEEGHEDEGHEENLGYLMNSDSETETKRFGVSKVGDWGYFGVSVNNNESLYGIPFHGDDHDDEHGGHDDDHEEEGRDEHEGERIFSKTNSDVINLAGAFNFDNSWIKRIDYSVRDSDYALTEQHAEGEEEHEEEGHEDHEEGPTTFTNNAREYWTTFDISTDSFSQKMVLNVVDEDTSVIGAEAFMQPTATKEKSIGYYLSTDLDLFHLDFGARYEQISRDGSVVHREEEHDDHDDEDDHDDDHDDDHAEEIDSFNKDFNNSSLALSIGRDINENVDINFGISRVERAPNAVELFMNGPHLATGRLENGNTNLKSESASNLDLTVNVSMGAFFGSFTLFKNDIDNYIYLQDETEEEHEEHEEEHDDHEGLTLANWMQKDAKLKGYEFELGGVFELGRGDLTVSYAKDSVQGKFKDGSNIARMIPSRNFYTISYSHDDLKVALNLKDVFSQNDIAVGETSTEAFQMLDLKIQKTFNLVNESELNLSVFANNLFDEVARNHTSFVKNEVPLPGRNYGIRASLKF